MKIEKKGVTTIHFLILTVLFVILLFILIYAIVKGQTFFDTLKILLPSFMFIKTNNTNQQIIGYNIGQDTMKYLDSGIRWLDFPEAPKKIVWNKKEISSENAKKQFADDYFYSIDKRDKNLKNIAISNLPTAAIIFSEPTKKRNFYENGDVFTNWAGTEENKIYKLKVINKIEINPYKEEKQLLSLYFKFNGKNWEWSQDLKKWEEVSENPSLEQEDYREFVDIIRKLSYVKNFEEGRNILLRKMESSPHEKYIYYSQKDSSIGEGDGDDKNFGEIIHASTSVIPQQDSMIKRDQIYFRFNGKNWEWALTKGWNNLLYPSGEEQWFAVSENPDYPAEQDGYKRAEVFKEIIKSLVGKNFNEGISIIEQKGNIQSTLDRRYSLATLILRHNPQIPLSEFNYDGEIHEQIYLRFNSKWQWSIDNQKWFDSEDERIISQDAQRKGPYIARNIRKLIILLRNKNLTEGENLLLSSQEVKWITKEEYASLIKLVFILRINDALLIKEWKKESGTYNLVEPPIELKNLAYPYINEIKQKGIIWRDSILQKPMAFKFDNDEKTYYFCVRKIKLADEVLLTIDLSKNVKENEKCKV